jgi:hypothetical protein
MSNRLYPAFKEALLSAGVDLTSVAVKCLLVDTGAYTYSAAHDYLDDVAAGARIATSGALAGKSVTGGVFDATDLVVPSVSGVQFEALILFISNPASPLVETDDLLIAYMDTGYANLPCTPDGGDITIVWPNDANKIFAL